MFFNIVQHSDDIFIVQAKKTQYLKLVSSPSLQLFIVHVFKKKLNLFQINIFLVFSDFSNTLMLKIIFFK